MSSISYKLTKVAWFCSAIAETFVASVAFDFGILADVLEKKRKLSDEK